MPKVAPMRQRVKITGVRLLDPRRKTGPRPPDKRPPNPGRFIVVVLTEPHTRNGVRYGPGEVRVREPLARDLQYAEDRIVESRRRFLEPQDHLINIRYASDGAMFFTPQPVPRGYFDEGFDQTDVWKGHAAPALHLRGPGR